MSGHERYGALKEQMAYEAARIMVEQGLTDFDRARRKAAERTGIRDRRNWPSNEAVQQAVITQRRLFLGQAYLNERRMLKQQALQAMRTFSDFSPRLVGTALTGVGDLQAGVELFLFADHPEDVIFALIDQKIPWKEAERSVRYAGGQRCAHPVFRFVAGEIPFQLVVLPHQARRHPPLDPITDRPQRGADAAEVRQMLEEEDAEDYRFEIGR